MNIERHAGVLKYPSCTTVINLKKCKTKFISLIYHSFTNICCRAKDDINYYVTFYMSTPDIPIQQQVT